MEFKPYQQLCVNYTSKDECRSKYGMTVEEFIKTFADDAKYISVITNEICIGGNRTRKLIFVSVFKKDDFPELELILNDIKNKEKKQNEET